MLHSIVFFQSGIFWFFLFVATVIGKALYSRYYHGLSEFNGPLLASFTDFWRFCHAYKNRHREPMLHMHARYGDVVRMGPDCLSFGQPQAIRDIYGSGKDFKKSGYYPVNAAAANGEYVFTLFSSIDELWHDNLRKSINWAFTPGAVAGYEHRVETTIQEFVEKLKSNYADRPGTDGVVDLSKWFLYFAFDVMGNLTYSVKHGFIESGQDVGGIIAYVQDFLSYGFFFGQMPALDLFVRHNPIMMWLQKRGLYVNSTFPGVSFAIKQLQNRQQSYTTIAKVDGDNLKDLLDKFLDAKSEHPQIVTDRELLSLSLTMMFAGSETTGLTLTAIFYYVIKTPGCYHKLQREIDSYFPNTGSDRPLSEICFSKVRGLPYLNACVQETFRIHPPFGSMYERKVPPAGAIVCGHFVPGGTVVGCNPWVVQRNKAVFGDDVDTYRPERWLEDPERVKEMHRSMFQFGGGNHVCLGKNISILEISKLMPSLIRQFEISLEDSQKNWSITTGANVRMSSVNVRLKSRN